MSSPSRTPVRDGSTTSPASTGDTTAPVLTVRPRDGQSATAPLVFTFDEAVKLGAGTITLNGKGISYSAALLGNPLVTVSGNTVSFTPPQQLVFGEWHSVQISANAITDLAGNPADGGNFLFAGFIAGLSPTAVNLTGTEGDDTLHGSELADTIDGAGGADLLLGYGGNDTLRGGGGNDSLNGGEGDDTLHGDADDDFLNGDYGNDRLFGGDGNDRLSGGNGDDLLDGGSGNDQLDGEGGHNTLLGGDGEDVLTGQSGSSGSLDGGAGNDRLTGYTGISYLGGSGNDTIAVTARRGETGTTTIDGGDGDDTIRITFATSGTQPDITVRGGTGSDTYSVSTVNTSSPSNIVITDFATGSGGDLINVLALPNNQAGVNPFVSGLVRLVASGPDTLLQLRIRTGEPPTYLTMLTLAGVQPNQLTSANFTSGVDPHGGTAGLSITGTEGDDRLDGGGLDDTIHGLGGNDIIDGGTGDDLIDGGAGNDILNGGAGNNTLRGGDGDDVLSGGVVLEGGAGNDRLQGATGNARMSGGEGNDELTLAYNGAGGHTVTMSGDAGADTLSIDATSQAVTVLASGGAGADTFVVRALTGLTILDFSPEDQLDLRALLARHVSGAISGNPFGPLGYLKAVQQGSHVHIYLDRDGAAGAGAAELVLKLDNTQLSALGSASFAGGYDPSGATRGLTLSGTPGPDTLSGAALDDTIDGGDGADTIDGGAGNDRLYGGDESAAGTGDHLHGGLGDDELHGGAGDDTLEGDQGNDVLYGDSGDDRLDGWDGDDLLVGGAGKDMLNGGNGNDRLEGGDGDDILQDGSGDNVLLGGAGNDTLSATGNLEDRAAGTTLDGGAGDDLLYVNSKVKTALGGAGNDRISVDIQGSAANRGEIGVDMGDGDDVLVFRQGAGTARTLRVSGGGGSDTYQLQYSNDGLSLFTVTDFQTGAGGDVLDVYSFLNNERSVNPFGAAGLARLVQDGTRVLFQIDPDGAAGAAGWTTRVVLENTRVADFTGANFPDGARPDGGSTGLSLVGTANADTLDGGSLDDVLRGGGGDDTLHGNAGADQLHGEAGADQLYGGDGNDRLEGGDGNDELYGGAGNDRLDGGAGDDILGGNVGVDELSGGAGNDRLTISWDNSGRFDGGDGDDTFIVYGDADASSTALLSGGTGRDTYQPHTVSTGKQVIVSDFTAGAGGDLIDLTRLLLATTSNPFAPGGSAQLLQRGADTVLQARMPGESAFLDVLVLRGVDKAALTSQNFVLGFDPDGGAGTTLTGGDGADRLVGSWSNDTIRGGAGDDVLLGGMGDDRLEGGEGHDMLDGDSGDGSTGPAPVDPNGVAWPTGYGGADVLDGGAGSDTLISSSGADTLLGGDGDDLLILTRPKAPATSLPAYQVLLDGGQGADWIIVDAHLPSSATVALRGGSGSDRFEIGGEAPPAALSILDFEAGAGGDVLDVFESFGWLRESPFASGHLLLEQRGADTVIRIDADGAAGAAAARDLVVLKNVARDALVGANFRYGHAPGDAALPLPPAVRAGAANDILAGDGRSDLLHGEAGNDVLTGHGGNDLLDGGAGIDTAVFSGVRNDYVLPDRFSPDTSQDMFVSDRRAGANDGKDRLIGIERLVFKDGAIALDTGADGVAGQAYRIYRAAFDREPDQAGLGFWIEMLDRGVSLQAVADGFTKGEEFTRLYGANPSNADIVTRLYRNILDREPEKGGYEFWLSVLDNKLTDLGTVLAAFSESPENRAAVAELIANGVDYQPFIG